MKKLLALAAAGSAVILLPAATLASSPTDFEAALDGNQETPPVSSQGSGEAVIHVGKHGTRVTYELEAAGLTDILFAHIHKGAPGTAGPVVVWLCGPSPAPAPAGTPACAVDDQDGTLQVEGVFYARDLVGPDRGLTISALVEQMASGNAYVNVHTRSHPTGEIRGKITVSDDD